MVFYSIMTPSAYAETSSTGGDASYYEEVFTLDEATGEITKISVTRVDVPQESSASSNAAAQEPSRYSGRFHMLVAPLILVVFPPEPPIPPS